MAGTGEYLDGGKVGDAGPDPLDDVAMKEGLRAEHKRLTLAAVDYSYNTPMGRVNHNPHRAHRKNKHKQNHVNLEVKAPARDVASPKSMQLDKARLDLNPPEAVFGMAMAFADGAAKRAPHNWEIGPDAKVWSVLDRLSAIDRHNQKLKMGQDCCEESGIHHAAHILANAAMIYTAYIREDIGNDDRLVKRRE